MSPFPKPTAFFGPQKRYMRTADWPWPYNIHLQLHDMQPGEHWTDTGGILLQNKRILTPTGIPGTFQIADRPWLYQVRHFIGEFSIIAEYIRPRHNTFDLHLQHLRHQFAYNEVQSPTGVFAYGGYATMSWEAL